MTVTDRHLALNEVKILSTLKHKNIIRYKNAFEEGSNFYIVMEYAEGGKVENNDQKITVTIRRYVIFYGIVNKYPYLYNQVSSKRT